MILKRFFLDIYKFWWPDENSVAQRPAPCPEGDRSTPAADQARPPEADTACRPREELALPCFDRKSPLEPYIAQVRVAKLYSVTGIGARQQTSLP